MPGLSPSDLALPAWPICLHKAYSSAANRAYLRKRGITADPRFMAAFVPYYQRAGGVLDRYDPAVLVAAARQVSDYDDEIPLRPEEITT